MISWEIAAAILGYWVAGSLSLAGFWVFVCWAVRSRRKPQGGQDDSAPE